MSVKPEFQCEANTEQDTPMKGLHQRFDQLIEMPSFISLYGEWIAKWWNWTLSIPKGEHPRDDFTPEKCSANQGGPVWFLSDQLGGREERTCTIPAGKAILFPLLTGECGYDVPEVKNDGFA